MTRPPPDPDCRRGPTAGPVGGRDDRRGRGMTLLHVGVTVGVSPETISRIERGRTGRVERQLLEAIARTVGLDPAAEASACCTRRRTSSSWRRAYDTVPAVRWPGRTRHVTNASTPDPRKDLTGHLARSRDDAGPDGPDREAAVDAIVSLWPDLARDYAAPFMAAVSAAGSPPGPVGRCAATSRPHSPAPNMATCT